MRSGTGGSFLKSRVFLMAVVMAGLAFFPGCMPQKKVLFVRDTDLTNRLNATAGDIYPENLFTLHHVWLTVFKKNLVMNGYLKVNRPQQSISLIAQNDMGGTIFEIHYIKDKKKDINVKVDLLKAEWLEKTVLQDLIRLYLAQPFSSPRLYRDKDQSLVLVQQEENITKERVYQKKQAQDKGYQLAALRYLKKGKVFYTVDFSYAPQNINAWPDYILVDNRKMHYQLKIKVQYPG